MSKPKKITSKHQKAIYDSFECQVKEFKESKRLSDERFKAELEKLESKLKRIRS